MSTDVIDTRRLVEVLEQQRLMPTEPEEALDSACPSDLDPETGACLCGCGFVATHAEMVRYAKLYGSPPPKFEPPSVFRILLTGPMYPETR